MKQWLSDPFDPWIANVPRIKDPLVLNNLKSLWISCRMEAMEKNLYGKSINCV